MKPLTEHQVAVLAYVCAHPGCTAQHVAHADGSYRESVRGILITLEGRGYIEETYEGEPYRVRYWPTELVNV